jgi:elongation factor G
MARFTLSIRRSSRSGWLLLGEFREAFLQTKPVILGSIMTMEVVAPVEFQSAPFPFPFPLFPPCCSCAEELNARHGAIIDSDVRKDEFKAVAEVPVALNDMFGYSSQLRGAT